MASVHLVFHVSMLKKCIRYYPLVIPIEDIRVKDSLTYEKMPKAILDRQDQKLRSKEIASVEVLWRNHKVKEGTQESEEDVC